MKLFLCNKKTFSHLFVFFVILHFLALSSFAKQTPLKKNNQEIKKQKADVLDSKFVRKIYKKQSQRLDSINQYKSKGIIGESTNGLIEIRTTESFAKNEVEKIKKIVAAENKDREELYKVIIQANQFNKDQEKILRESMFKSRLDVDPNGTYYMHNTYWQKK
jgi:uncharacterized protein